MHATAKQVKMAQNFVGWPLGSSRLITVPTYEGAHTPDLVRCSDQNADDVKVGDICSTPLSWPNCYLVSFRLTGTHYLRVWGGWVWNMFTGPALED